MPRIRSRAFEKSITGASVFFAFELLSEQAQYGASGWSLTSVTNPSKPGQPQVHRTDERPAPAQRRAAHSSIRYNYTIQSGLKMQTQLTASVLFI